MGSLLARLRAALAARTGRDRQHTVALAAHLGVSEAEASVIYRRSREVGFGAAMREHEDAADRDEPPAGASGPPAQRSA